MKEQITVKEVKICEHVEKHKRRPILYHGPINEILGPWYSHFVDYYVCDECEYKLKEITKSYNHKIGE